MDRLLTAARVPYSALAHCGATTSTANPKEIAFYNKHAQTWWDPKGPFKALLPYNDVRIPFIERQLQRTRTTKNVAETSSILKGVRILDVGSGGGFLSEGLAEKGATVVGVDISEESVKVARSHKALRLEQLEQQSDAHAALQSLQYLNVSIESLRDRIVYSPISSMFEKEDKPAMASNQDDLNSVKPELFDVVVASEVIEHVNNPDSFMNHCCDLVKPGGILVITCPNRTPLSGLLLIFLAEYVFGMLPKGTHLYSNFRTPSEVSQMAERFKFRCLETTGVLYVPGLNKWFTEPTKWTSYMQAFHKPG